MLPENTPKYDPETHVVTIPYVEGIQWRINGHPVARTGPQPPLQEDGKYEVEAVAVGRVRIRGESKWTFTY